MGALLRSRQLWIIVAMYGCYRGLRGSTSPGCTRGARDGGWWGRSAVGSTFLAATAALLVADALMRDRGLAVVLISLGFGVSDLMLPSAWASCLDVAGQHADAVAGVPDTAGQGGGFLCTVVFGYPVGWSGDYDLPVYAIAAIVALSANLFTRIDASRPLIENAS
ncbi:MAG: hypothetical protein R2729_05755 [Bryobacteraceae bacterium]